MNVSLCGNVCFDELVVTHNDIRRVYKRHKTHENIIKSKLKVSQIPTNLNEEIL